MNPTTPNAASPAAGVIWITGYSASGKTTVCRKVNAALRRLGVKTVFLDGDDLRSIFGAKWGYDYADRTELARVYLRLASHLASQGVTVVFSAVAMYAEVFEWFRGNVPNPFLAYLDVPMNVRVERDRLTKGVYRQLSGADARYTEPDAPDIVVHNHGGITADRAASDIVSAYLSGNAVRATDRGKNSYWNAAYLTATGVLGPTAFAKFVAPQLPDRPGSLLEVGCGNGRDAAWFAADGMRVTAIDTSETAIALCKKLHKNKLLEFIHAGISGLATATAPAPFEAMYSRFVLHAMTAQEEVEFISGAHRLLTDGGLLFIECRSINDPMARLGEVISPTERIHGHYRRFIVLDELLESLQAAGFAAQQVIERKGLAVFGDEDPVVIRVVCRKRA